MEQVSQPRSFHVSLVSIYLTGISLFFLVVGRWVDAIDQETFLIGWRITCAVFFCAIVFAAIYLNFAYQNRRRNIEQIQFDFILACRAGHYEEVEDILDKHPAKILERAKDNGYGVFFYIIENRDHGLMKKLLDRGLKPDPNKIQNTIEHAINNGDRDMVLLLEPDSSRS